MPLGGVVKENLDSEDEPSSRNSTTNIDEKHLFAKPLTLDALYNIMLSRHWPEMPPSMQLTLGYEVMPFLTSVEVVMTEWLGLKNQVMCRLVGEVGEGNHIIYERHQR